MGELEFPENKNVFKISEAAELLGVKPYVLRYWETEFNEARTRKSYSGQRVYNREDIRRIFEIKGLLYESKYSIAGAREVLKQRRSDEKKPGEKQAHTLSDHAEVILRKQNEFLYGVIRKLQALEKKVCAFELTEE